MHPEIALTPFIADRVSSVAGSTCSVDFPDLPCLIERALVAAAGRAKSAADRRAARSKRIRKAIALANGALPASLDITVRALTVYRRLQARPSHYGLKRAPPRRKVRELLKDGTSGSRPTPDLVSNRHIPSP